MSDRVTRRGWATPPAAIVVLAILGVGFVAIPLLGLVARAPWSRVWDALTLPGTRSALILSLSVSITAALLSLLLGFPLAWLLARATFRGRSFLRAVVILPLVLPPVVGGVALLSALGRRGLLGRLLEPLGITLPFTTAGAVVAATFVSFPLLVLVVEAGIRSMDDRLEGAAATLGASRWYALRRVTIPVLAPQLVAGTVLAWARALGEFGATITFAGNLRGRTQTLPLAVFETLQTDPEAATIQALIMVALSLGVLLALRSRFFPRTDR